MRATRGIGVFLILLIALFYFTARITGPLATDSPTLAQYLPKDTFLYVEMPDRGYMDFLALLQAPPFAQLISDEPIDIHQKIEEEIRLGKGSLKYLLGKLRGLYFVVESVDDRPHPAFVLELESDDAAQNAVKKLAPDDAEVFRIRIPGGPRFSGMAHHRFIVLAPSRRTLGRLTGRIIARRRVEDSLAGNQRFKAAVKELRSRSLAWACLNGERCLELADKDNADERKYVAVRNILGLEGAKWASAGIFKDGRFSTVELNIHYDQKVLRPARIFPESEALTVLDQVPPDAFGCAALTLNDPHELWIEIKQLLTELMRATDAKREERDLNEFDATLGLSKKDSILSELEGQMALFLARTNGLPDKRDWIAVLRLKNADRFRTAFAEFQKRTMRGQTFKTDVADGIEIYAVPDDKGFVTITGNSAVVSGSRKALLWFSKGPQGAGRRGYRNRVSSVYPLDLKSTIAAQINAGTFLSFLPRRMKEQGKFDAFVGLDVVKSEDKLSITLKADTKWVPRGLFPIFPVVFGARSSTKVHEAVVEAAPPDPAAGAPAR